MVEKELPIKISFGDDVARPRKFSQHIKRVRVYGPEDEMPEELRLDAAEIAEGGVLTIDDLSLPEDFEVLDRRESESIITVERPKKDKRGKRDEWDDDHK